MFLKDVLLVFYSWLPIWSIHFFNLKFYNYFI
jgi:hypothetical protein